MLPDVRLTTDIQVVTRPNRIQVMLVAVLAALCALPAAAGAHSRARAHAAVACANADTPVTAASRPALKKAVVCLIDQQRAEHGLPGLAENDKLDRSAQEWTNEMVSSGDFDHGDDFSARITAVGFKWSAAGENIATGFETPRSVVDAWMGSTGHCQNILAPYFSAVGTGLVPKTASQWGTEFATWTQDFALPMGASYPSQNYAAMRGCPYTVS
jgi:uncharacterized protein YkwD